MRVIEGGTSRLLSRDAAAAMAEALRRESKKVAFTNGVFDLLHPGHVRYLEVARSLGGALIVGLNGDESVRRNRALNADHAAERTRGSAARALVG